MFLKSRPHVPPFGDLENLEAPTTSHLFIDASTTFFSQPSCPETRLNQVTHWEVVKTMRNHFWDHWWREYPKTHSCSTQEEEVTIEFRGLRLCCGNRPLTHSSRWSLASGTHSCHSSRARQLNPHRNNEDRHRKVRSANHQACPTTPSLRGKRP